MVREFVVITLLISLISGPQFCCYDRDASMLYEVMTIENVLRITSRRQRRLLFLIG